MESYPIFLFLLFNHFFIWIVMLISETEFCIKASGEPWKRNFFLFLQLHQSHLISLPRGDKGPSILRIVLIRLYTQTIYRTVWNIQMFNYFDVLTQGLDKIFYSKYDLIVWNLQMIRCLMFWPKTKTKFHSKPRKYYMFCKSSLNFEIDVLIFVFVNCPVVFLRFIYASESHWRPWGLWVCSSSTIYKWEARRAQYHMKI